MDWASVSAALEDHERRPGRQHRLQGVHDRALVVLRERAARIATRYEAVVAEQRGESLGHHGARKMDIAHGRRYFGLAPPPDDNGVSS